MAINFKTPSFESFTSLLQEKQSIKRGPDSDLLGNFIKGIGLVVREIMDQSFASLFSCPRSPHSYSLTIRKLTKSCEI